LTSATSWCQVHHRI